MGDIFSRRIIECSIIAFWAEEKAEDDEWAGKERAEKEK